ncbi:hypothetical protein GALL_457610 [mine drainage metagenome]|uniref:Uncharacterized protein n=1 Tax=mine drainage metagenome TaxID=410659 RepID=A0A1J5PN90_9ZZZZ
MRGAREEGGGGIEAQRLVDDLTDVGQPWDVGCGGGAGAKDRLRLVPRTGLHGLIEGGEVERPGEGEGGGVVPRDDEGQQVIAQLCRGHAAVGGGVLAIQQQVKQVGDRVGPTGAAGVDRGVGDPLHIAHRLGGTDAAKARNPCGRADHVQQRNPRGVGDVVVDGTVHDRAVESIAAGQGNVGDHLKRGGDHFIEQVGGAAGGGVKSRGGMFGGARHHRGKVGDVAVRENRGCDAALPVPMRAFRDEQAVTDRGAQNHLGHVGFGVILDRIAQDASVRLWVHHHVPALAGAARDDGNVGGELWDQLQHITARVAERAEDAQRLCHQRHLNRRGGCGGGKKR